MMKLEDLNLLRKVLFGFLDLILTGEHFLITITQFIAIWGAMIRQG